MFVNKIGKQHIDFGVNCQDFGVISKDQPIMSCLHDNRLIHSDIKVVCDGCSEGLHTEVGAKSFIHLLHYYNYDAKFTFEELNKIFGQSTKSLKDYMSFTILYAFEDDGINSFRVFNCGDGYIIGLTNMGEIEFIRLDDGEYPKYYVYNYIDPKYLKYYSEGVSFEEHQFSREQYVKIGVASDGIRFVFDQDESFQNRFKKLLENDKEAAMKRFINMNKSVFRDDVTIAF